MEEGKIREQVDQQAREALKRVPGEIMNEEAEELICTGPSSAARAGVTTAGGTRRRKIKTRVGEMELSVFRLRTLAFQTMTTESATYAGRSPSRRRLWRCIRSSKE